MQQHVLQPVQVSHPVGRLSEGAAFRLSGSLSTTSNGSSPLQVQKLYRLWLSVCDASRRSDRSPSQQAGRVAGRVTGRWRAAKISKQPSKQIDREDR